MSPKTGPKSQKTASGPPHISDKKNTLQTQKMNPKSWKTRAFFTFSWPRFGGRGDEQVYSVLGERHDLSKTGGFFQKSHPLQVNLNLGCLMPSRWSRPLHLRCGRISIKSGHWADSYIIAILYTWTVQATPFLKFHALIKCDSIEPHWCGLYWWQLLPCEGHDCP